MLSVVISLRALFNKIIDSGVTTESTTHHRYRLRSINSFCVFCIIVSSPYFIIFYQYNLHEAFISFLVFHFLFMSVIWLNAKEKFLFSKLILLLNTNGSVLIISLMLGIESGFHLYIPTAALFVFWLFDNQEVQNIVITFLVYVGLYLAIFYYSSHYFPIYRFYFRVLGLTMYDLNVLLSLLLIFFMFYNYFTYYKLLTNDLIDKQKKLETEITMRRDSQGETKKLFDDLSVSYKNLEQFSYVVSHNMRAPLANIKGFVSLYDKTRPGTEQNSQIVGYVETAANHLDDILSDLNYILKNRERALENKVELDFKKIVNEIARSLSKEIATTEAVVNIQVDQKASIFTIKSALTNILYNLMENALKYRKNFESPIISLCLDTSSDSRNYCLKIEDNGIGIDLLKHKDKVFKLYSRLNKNVDGKGMGLYLVKSQVEVLGGTIDIESEPNKGTTFTIKLPK